GEPAPAEKSVQTLAAEMLEPSPAFAGNDQASAEPTAPEQEVEVGEAPEEVPEEPGEESAPGEKRRRRRRRRRRRGGEGGPEGQPAAAEANGEAAESLPSAAEPPSGDADDEEDEFGGDE